MSNLDVVILAAGKGTRMKTSTPKVLHKVCGQTIIERILRAVVSLAPQKVVLVLGHQQQMISDYLDKLRQSKSLDTLPIEIVIQEPQGGTGHAVQIARRAFSKNSDYCLILPGDIPLIRSRTLLSLAQQSLEHELDLSMLSFIAPLPNSFGKIVRNENADVVAIVENKDCTDEQKSIQEVNSGIYCAKTSFLSKALPSLKKANAQGEFYLTDIVSWGHSQNLKIDSFLHEDCTELAGANSISELYQLELHARQLITQRLMESGVSFENPQCVYIDEDVRVEPDAFIGANTRLLGNTHVHRGTILEGDSRIIDSSIGEGSVIKVGSVIEGSKVGKNCSVGPFAHLRPQSNLGEDVKVGNFVELKKSTLERGVKAGHLSYLGDAIIAQNANIGAGTITCNYDGVDKHQTIIGRGAFIGSNSSLVAPVTVGEGAYIGAGSVITKGVPANSLGLARGRQTIIENWAKGKQKSGVVKPS